EALETRCDPRAAPLTAVAGCADLTEDLPRLLLQRRVRRRLDHGHQGMHVGENRPGLDLGQEPAPGRHASRVPPLEHYPDEVLLPADRVCLERRGRAPPPAAHAPAPPTHRPQEKKNPHRGGRAAPPPCDLTHTTPPAPREAH